MARSPGVQKNAISVPRVHVKMMGNVPTDGDHTYAIVVMAGQERIAQDHPGGYLVLIEAHNWNSDKICLPFNYLGKPRYLSKPEQPIVHFYQ